MRKLLLSSVYMKQKFTYFTDPRLAAAMIDEIDQKGVVELDPDDPIEIDIPNFLKKKEVKWVNKMRKDLPPEYNEIKESFKNNDPINAIIPANILKIYPSFINAIYLFAPNQFTPRQLFHASWMRHYYNVPPHWEETVKEYLLERQGKNMDKWLKLTLLSLKEKFERRDIDELSLLVFDPKTEFDGYYYHKLITSFAYADLGEFDIASKIASSLLEKTTSEALMHVAKYNYLMFIISGRKILKTTVLPMLWDAVIKYSTKAGGNAISQIYQTFASLAFDQLPASFIDQILDELFVLSKYYGEPSKLFKTELFLRHMVTPFDSTEYFIQNLQEDIYQWLYYVLSMNFDDVKDDDYDYDSLPELIKALYKPLYDAIHGNIANLEGDIDQDIKQLIDIVSNQENLRHIAIELIMGGNYVSAYYLLKKMEAKNISFPVNSKLLLRYLKDGKPIPEISPLIFFQDKKIDSHIGQKIVRNLTGLIPVSYAQVSIGNDTTILMNGIYMFLTQSTLTKVVPSETMWPTPVPKDLVEDFVQTLSQFWGGQSRDLFKDTLTGLYNRKFFTERVREVQEEVKRYPKGQYAALIFIDVNNFKKINDTLGHLFGDEVLKGIAKILQKSVRSYDVVSRIGGDEFVIILPNVKGDEAIHTIIGRIERNMQIFVNQKTEFKELGLGLAIGYTFIDPDKDIDEIIHKADLKAYEDKKRKKAVRKD